MKLKFDEDLVCSLYESGLSAENVGKHFGVSKIPIFRVLRSRGVRMRPSNKIEDLQAKRALAIDLYRSGMTIPEVCKQVGVGKNNVAKFIADAGVERRVTADYAGSVDWKVKASIDADEIKRLYEGGMTISQIARKFGVGFGTARRHLVAAGATLRPVSSVPTYIHKSPVAGSIRVRGTWELLYAKVLDIWYGEGKILCWQYEAERIPVNDVGAGRYYLPDFRVVAKSGVVAFHEVKGVLRELAAEKIRVARSSGVRVVLVRKELLYAICRHYGLPVTAKAS